MSDDAATPSDGTRTQETDPLLSFLGEVLAGQEQNTDALATIGREVHSIQVELSGAVRSFEKAHGHRGSAEDTLIRELKFLRQDLALCRGEIRNVQQGVDEIRSRVAGIELWAEGNRDRVELLEARVAKVEDDGGANGSGHA